jgi:hypothetical protein
MVGKIVRNDGQWYYKHKKFSVILTSQTKTLEVSLSMKEKEELCLADIVIR